MLLYNETVNFSNGHPWKGNLLTGNHTMILLISSSCVAWWQCFCTSDSALLMSVPLPYFGRVSGAEKAKEITRSTRDSFALSWEKNYVGFKGKVQFYIIRGKIVI